MQKAKKPHKVFISALAIISFIFIVFLVSKNNSERTLLIEKLETREGLVAGLNVMVQQLTRSIDGCERKLNVLSESNFNRTIEKGGDEPQLAILVPFRGWDVHKEVFKNYMTTYMNTYGFNAVFVITTQKDDFLFNRGSLLNIGALEVTRRIPSIKYFILHDIDRLPTGYVDYSYGALLGMNEELYPQYAGGVLKISRHIFEGINGFSNCFWGWGEEDDNLYMRIHDSIHGGLLVNGVKIPRKGYEFFHVPHQEQNKTHLKKSRELHHFIYSNRLTEGLPPVYSYEGLSSVDYVLSDSKFDFPHMELEVHLRGPSKDECLYQYTRMFENREVSQLWKHTRGVYGNAPMREDLRKKKSIKEGV